MQIQWGLTNGADAHTVSANAWGNYSSANIVGGHVTNQYNHLGAVDNAILATYREYNLELGSVATDFEHRSFAQELALCQRYYYKHFGRRK